jgi:DNA-binding LacI/PurR family transcriptional regulator
MYQPDKNPNESRWSYLRVAQQIRREILNGTYKAGKRLPGEPALAGRFGVGRLTVARALEVLERSNLVFRVRGSGTYIQRDVVRGAVRLTIGYLAHDAEVPHNLPGGAALEAAHYRLEELGHTVRLLTCGEMFASGQPAANLRRMVRAGDLDGLILSRAVGSDMAIAINDVLPVVSVIDDNVPDGMFNVAVDFTLGYFLAVRHLLDLGHRNIGLLGGRTDGSVGYRALQSFRLAMQLSGLDPDRQPVQPCGCDTPRCRAIAERMLRERPDLTALMCVDDAAAIGAVQAAGQLGRRVPAGLSVVGCNDVSAVADPPLTTLHVDFAQVGRLAVDLLLGGIFGRSVATRVYVEPRLVVRASTAPPMIA